MFPIRTYLFLGVRASDILKLLGDSGEGEEHVKTCVTPFHTFFVLIAGKLLKTGWNTRQQDHWLLVLILMQLL